MQQRLVVVALRLVFNSLFEFKSRHIAGFFLAKRALKRRDSEIFILYTFYSYLETLF